MSGSKMPMYVINLVTGTHINIDLVPEELSEDFAANFEDISPRGRSNSIQGYDTSGPHTVSFSIKVHEDYCKDGFMTTMNRLRALTYPGYEGRVEPPKCYIRIGRMIAMTATPRSVGVSWAGVIRDGHFTSADVSFSFTEAESIPNSVDDVERGAWS